jgi:Flp pilus assembly CpaE family ATPase
MSILCGVSPALAAELAATLAPAPRVCAGLVELADQLAADPAELLVILGPGIEPADAMEFARRQRADRPALGVLLARPEIDVELLMQALRAGVREVVRADDPAGLAAAGERSLALSRSVGAPVPAAEGGRPGTVITVFSAKGGTGKTTTATNLAVALAAGGTRRVCLVDLDLAFGDVAISLQLPPERTIADAIPVADTLDADGARALLTDWGKGLACVLAPVGPGEAERVPVGLVTRLLTALRPQVDYLVVDTPSQFSEHVLAALDLSQRQVLLTTPDLPALKNLRLTLDMLDLLGYSRDGRAVVLNRAGSKVGLTEADVERAIAAEPTVLVPSSRDVPASVNRGVPLVAAAPGHKVSVAFGRLASWCEQAGTAAPVAPQRRPALRVRRSA